MSGKRDAAYPVFLLWGAFLVVLTAVAVVFFRPDVSTPALLGGNAAVVIVLALLLAITRRSVQSDGGGADPDASPATVWLALSVVLMAVGAALGPWLVLIGGGMTAVGIAAEIRELRAQRGALRAAALSERGLGEAGLRGAGGRDAGGWKAGRGR